MQKPIALSTNKKSFRLPVDKILPFLIPIIVIYSGKSAVL
jgi:hypothetical protein